MMEFEEEGTTLFKRVYTKDEMRTISLNAVIEYSDTFFPELSTRIIKIARACPNLDYERVLDNALLNYSFK